MTFGFCRDDAEGKFLPDYLRARRCCPSDPFQTLDVDGVGQLVEHGVASAAARRGRTSSSASAASTAATRQSIAFCHKAGLDYVSCSPFRVPIARLAAAQAALRRSDARVAS